MANVLNKFMGFLGLDDEEELEEVVEGNEEDDQKEAPVFSPKNTKNQSKVVNIHTASSIKIIISKPKDFEEATDICDDLKSRKIVVVNASELEPKTAQRLLDFMCGACYVLNGELQEVEKKIYVLSPSNVEVSNELKSQLSTKGIFNWNK